MPYDGANDARLEKGLHEPLREAKDAAVVGDVNALATVVRAAAGKAGDAAEQHHHHRDQDLKVKNGRKNVKSAPYRPILRANRIRQRPPAGYAHTDPAQTGQNGGN